MLERLHLDGNETVLDAGCGTGRVTDLLLERLPRGRAIALDASPSMLAEARRRLARFGLTASKSRITLDQSAGRPATNAADWPHAEASKPLPKSYVRLTQPLVRDTRGAELRPATWDEALDRTVAGLRAAMATQAAGARSPIGIFSCSKATNEVNFVAQKLSRVVLGSNNIDSCNRT